MLKLLADTLRAPLRYRTRHGFGVHSPFAYRLITEVYGERYLYYAYSRIPVAGGDFAHRLRLLFRLAVRFHSMPFVFVGDPDSEALATLAMVDSSRVIAVNPAVIPAGCFTVYEGGAPGCVPGDEGVTFFLDAQWDGVAERGCMVFVSCGTVLVVRRADFPGQVFWF